MHGEGSERWDGGREERGGMVGEKREVGWWERWTERWDGGREERGGMVGEMDREVGWWERRERWNGGREERGGMVGEMDREVGWWEVGWWEGGRERERWNVEFDPVYVYIQTTMIVESDLPN